MDLDTTAIKASIIDGIALTPRFRERSLAALHHSLETKRSEIVQALSKERGGSSSSATLQYLLTLDAVHKFHASVEPGACLKEEYKVAKSSNQEDRWMPYGYAYIELASNDLLYSAIVPVAAAIAAGNCALLQIADESAASSHMISTVKDLLMEGLSSEIFSCVTTDPFDEDFQRRYRAPSINEPSSGDRSSIDTLGLTSVIVDRTAHVKDAAKDCAHARFGLGSTSPYAPDFVLVNEFCLEDFISAAGETALQYLNSGASRTPSHLEKGEVSENSDLDVPAVLSGKATTLVSGPRGRIMLMRNRDSSVLSQMKTRLPLLVILPISSLDDAIDLLATLQSPMLASYIYADPRFAKYLDQFTRSRIALINHIPMELLVGPPAPTGSKTEIHPRYSPRMFSWPSPVMVESPSAAGTALGSLRSGWQSLPTSSLEASLRKPLVRQKEEFGPSVGFFEQGIFVGLGLVVSTVIVGCGLCLTYGLPLLKARIRR